jgi:hypothetical protein
MLAIVLYLNYSMKNQKDGKSIRNKKKTLLLPLYKDSDSSLSD